MSLEDIGEMFFTCSGYRIQGSYVVCTIDSAVTTVVYADPKLNPNSRLWNSLLHT